MKRFMNMNRWRRMVLVFGVLTLWTIAIFTLVPSVAEGDVPKLVNFQGILRDGSGNPVADGSYFVTFRIYDLPAAGTILWADTQTVATSDGLFNAVLGTGEPVPDTVFNDSVRYLGITVFPDAEMTPRQRLTTSGYSFRSGEWTTLGENLFRLNGNVGIGTTNPLGRLHLSGNNYKLLLQSSGNADVVIGRADATRYGNFILADGDPSNGANNRWAIGLRNGDSKLHLYDELNSSNVMVLQQGGNVGIGETVPLARLHVQRMEMSLPSTGALTNEDIIIEDDDAVLGLYSGTGGTFGSAISLGEIDAGVFADKWTMYRTKNLAGARLSFAYGPDTSYAANPALMSLDGPNGRVGIGTISPSTETKLHIRHFDVDNFGLLIDAHGVSGTEIGLHAGPLAYGSLAKNTYFDAGWQRFNTANGAFLQEIEPDGDVLFRTAPAAANPISWNNPLFFNAAGKVGIGTTSVYADANTDLTLPGSIGFKNGTAPMMYMYESGSSNSTKRVIAHSPGFPTWGLLYNDSTDAFYLSGPDLGIGTSSPAARLHVAGTAGNNTGVWSNLSDRRLKKEIEPISGALESVLQLKGVTFRWKDETMDAEFGRVRGLVAQDVEKVIPEWIKTDPDGHKRLEPIGIDALLIEAIKELKAENNELKKRLLKLEQARPQAKAE